MYRLLCYCYWGAPDDPNVVVHHLCNHKMCIIAWHLAYKSQSVNVSHGWIQRKRSYTKRARRS